MAKVVIPLFYHLDRRIWTDSLTATTELTQIEIGQSNTIDFAVRFCNVGVATQLTSPAPVWICAIKAINDFAGVNLLLTTTGVLTGAGSTSVYTFTLLIDSSELRAWLLTVTGITALASLEIRDTNNNIATLPALTCSILPDYTLVGTTPTAASGTLIVDSGQTFTVHKTFAMPTTDGFNNYVLKTNGAGVGSWAVDSAGTGTVTNVAVTTANGVSGSVANPTTSAAITLTLGAITPTTGAFSDATEATSSTSAPLKTAGGMAVAKSLYVGQFSYFADHATFNGDVVANSFRGSVAGSIVFSSTDNETSLTLPQVTGSVNYVTIEPSVTGSPVHIYAQGGDANIGLHLRAKGTGFFNVEDGTDTTKRLRFSASGNSSGITTTLASSSTASQTITLPNAAGTIALTANNLSAFASTTSAQLAGVISDETGTGKLIFSAGTFASTAAQTYTFPTTTTTIAGLAVAQTFTQANTFSASTASLSTTSGAVVITGGLGVGGNAYVGGVINLPATTSTAGQITQAGSRLLHTFGGAGNLWFGLTTGNTAGTLTGGNNVGIGTNAGKSMTSGANNMLIGSSAGEIITTGYNNVAVGASSGYNIGAGTYNTAIGYVALQFGGSGGYNTAIGQASLQNITSGTLNTCIGSDSGDDTSTVGGLAGANITSGASNTLIGALAASTSATGSFRTAIGSGSRCQSDNAIKLGRDTLDKVIIPSWSAAPTTSLSAGMLYYDTALAKLRVYTTAWETITSV